MSGAVLRCGRVRRRCGGRCDGCGDGGGDARPSSGGLPLFRH